MTWTKCDYDDPSTLPAKSTRVLFVTNWPFQQVLTGDWEPSIKAWCEDTHDDASIAERVTHWQPLPALPGEEPKPDPWTRLGRWLSAVQCRTHRQFPPEGRHSTWCVRLVEDAGEEDESDVGEGEGPTLEAALAEALTKVGA